MLETHKLPGFWRRSRANSSAQLHNLFCWTEHFLIFSCRNRVRLKLFSGLYIWLRLESQICWPGSQNDLYMTIASFATMPCTKYSILFLFCLIHLINIWKPELFTQFFFHPPVAANLTTEASVSVTRASPARKKKRFTYRNYPQTRDVSLVQSVIFLGKLTFFKLHDACVMLVAWFFREKEGKKGISASDCSTIVTRNCFNTPV